MPNRKELKGIAAGLAGTFVSRNNDLNGYWAMGILYLITNKVSSKQFFLNLLTGDSSPKTKYSKELSIKYNEYPFSLLRKRGFDKSQIKEAKIEIEFNGKVTSEHIKNINTWGEPYKCSVTLIDDLNKKRFFEIKGWYGKHDPRREIRSLRNNKL